MERTYELGAWLGSARFMRSKRERTTAGCEDSETQRGQSHTDRGHDSPWSSSGGGRSKKASQKILSSESGITNWGEPELSGDSSSSRTLGPVMTPQPHQMRASSDAPSTDGAGPMKFRQPVRWLGAAVAFVMLVTGVMIWKHDHEDATKTAPVERLTTPRLKGHQVWGHYIGHGLPLWDDLDGGDYGDHYYLDLVHGGPGAERRKPGQVARARAAGLTGMQVLLGRENSGADFIADWLSEADPTWSGGRQGFSVAPVLADADTSNAVRLVSEYAKAAKGHPSAARVESRLLVFLYGSRHGMQPKDWEAVREGLRHRGIEIYLIGDILPETSKNAGRVPTREIAPYLDVFDASWLFESETPEHWNSIAKMLNQAGKPFVGGITPGYNRETPNGANIEPRATEKLRQEWELALGYGASWQVVNTWNDLVEQSEISPTSTWNVTRSDINAFYAAKLTQNSFPSSRAELYATTPRFVTPGEPIRAEGLVLNPTSDTVTVRVELLDRDGKPLGPSKESEIGSAQLGEATIMESLSEPPSGGFVRMRATSRDAGGRVMQSVVSAPIVVYPSTKSVGSDLRRTYYSIPARKALKAPVRLEIIGQPTSTARATAQLDGAGKVRFLDVLQNTRLAQRQYARPSAKVTIPRNRQTVIGGQQISTTASGFYVGRVIGDDDSVGYSDPVYVTP